jgi:hypothetical protein
VVLVESPNPGGGAVTTTILVIAFLNVQQTGRDTLGFGSRFCRRG